MQCLTLTQLDFYNAMLYGLPNKDLHGFQMILKAARGNIANMLRYRTDTVTPKAVAFLFLPIKLIVKFRIFLLDIETLLFGEWKYIKSLLQSVSK